VLIGDLIEAGQRVLLAQGGIGGRGNARFVSSTNRAPRRFEEGLPGETKLLQLHLKLLADVGLVGFPNAGKSTLISRISAARPKIADYPFTTLVPNLGVVSLSGNRSFVVADVPGLIEGAHEGKGLGDRFLKHLDRTKVLVHLVDVSGASGRDPIEDFETILRELAAFSADLAAKPQIVAATKMDAVAETDAVDALETHVRGHDLQFLRISAVTGEGLGELQEAVWRYLTPIAQAGSPFATAEVVARREKTKNEDWHPGRDVRSDSSRPPRSRIRRRAEPLARSRAVAALAHPAASQRRAARIRFSSLCDGRACRRRAGNAGVRPRGAP